MKYTYIKRIGKHCLILLLGGIIGTLLLTLAFMLPINSENVNSSYEVLKQEGWHPAMPVLSQSFETHFHSHLPGDLDNSTDSIMIYTAADNHDGNPLTRAMSMYSDYCKENYERYWHGYVAILRPLLYIFSYTELRIINCFLQLLLIFALFYHIIQRKGWVHGLLMMTSYALLMPFAVSMSLQFTWVFYIAMLGCLILLKKQAYFEQNSRYTFLFMIAGMLTSYMDLLTYPLVTWGIPILWWTILREPEEKKFSHCKSIIFSGISWIIGYAVMWASKWIYASAILGTDILGIALEQIILRTGSEAGAKMTMKERFIAISTNWEHYEYSIYMIILAIWLIWFVYRSLRYEIHTSARGHSYILIGLSSIVWYLVLADHTAGHHFFTYRIYNISITAVLVLIIESVYQPGAKDDKAFSFVKFAKTTCCLVIISALAFATAMQAREEVFTHNGYVETQEFQLEQGIPAEAYFSPSFSRVKNFYIGLRTDDSEGYCILSVLQEDKLLYREEIPLSAFNEKSYFTIDVNWNLATDKIYQLQIDIQNNQEDVYLVCTTPAEQPLSEYLGLRVYDTETDGQPISGFTYSALPSSNVTILFLTMTWFAIFSSISIMIYTVITASQNQTHKE